MKSCTHCNRTETDDALSYCRVDGTLLVRESNSVSGNAVSGSAPHLSDTETVPLTELISDTPVAAVLLGNGQPGQSVATTLLPSPTPATGKLASFAPDHLQARLGCAVSHGLPTSAEARSACRGTERKDHCLSARGVFHPLDR